MEIEERLDSIEANIRGLNGMVSMNWNQHDSVKIISQKLEHQNFVQTIISYGNFSSLLAALILYAGKKKIDIWFTTFKKRRKK